MILVESGGVTAYIKVDVVLSISAVSSSPTNVNFNSDSLLDDSPYLTEGISNVCRAYWNDLELARYVGSDLVS